MSQDRTPREEIEDLLDAHDGDDRCGCLAESIRILIGEEDDYELAEASVRDILRRCIAEHPAGTTFRKRSVSDALGDDRNGR